MSKKPKAEKHARRIAKLRKDARRRGRKNPFVLPSFFSPPEPTTDSLTDMALDFAIRQASIELGRSNALKILAMAKVMGLGKFLDRCSNPLEPQPQTDKIQ